MSHGRKDGIYGLLGLVFVAFFSIASGVTKVKPLDLEWKVSVTYSNMRIDF